MRFPIEKAEMTGLSLDRYGGSVAAFDNRYLPLLHRKGFVAPNLPIAPEGVGSPGGYVFDSKPGIYNNVVVLDFKSLYPSIIRSFFIDPLALAQAQIDGTAHDQRSLTSTEIANLDRYSPGFNHAAYCKQVTV